MYYTIETEDDLGRLGSRIFFFEPLIQGYRSLTLTAENAHSGRASDNKILPYITHMLLQDDTVHGLFVCRYHIEVLVKSKQTPPDPSALHAATLIAVVLHGRYAAPVACRTLSAKRRYMIWTASLRYEPIDESLAKLARQLY